MADDSKDLKEELERLKAENAEFKAALLAGGKKINAPTVRHRNRTKVDQTIYQNGAAVRVGVGGTVLLTAEEAETHYALFEPVDEMKAKK